MAFSCATRENSLKAGRPSRRVLRRKTENMGPRFDAFLRRLGKWTLNSRRGRFAVLIYHRVLEQPDPLFPDEIDRNEFARHIETLKTYFQVISLSEAIERSQRGQLSAGSVCITFDDGYADNAEVAMPMLASAEITATFFVATGYLNGGVMWNDSIIHALRHTTQSELDLGEFDLGTLASDSQVQRKKSIRDLIDQLKYRAPAERDEISSAILAAARVAAPSDLMMTDSQVRDLSAAGMEIGAHTATHPILTKVSLTEAEEDIRRGREYLKEITGELPHLFAYPNGRPSTDFSKDHVDMVRRLGFSAAVTTAPGAPHEDSDLFQIPRFTPWDRSQPKFALRIVHNAMLRHPTYL